MGGVVVLAGSPDNAFNFRAYVTSDGIEPPFYLIESTAPNEVDDKSVKSIRGDELKKVGLQAIPPQDAIKKIALRLTPAMNDTPEDHANLSPLPPKSSLMIPTALSCVQKNWSGLATIGLRRGCSLLC
jgi:hypothetical protein